jgi:transmembrane sensor
MEELIIKFLNGEANAHERNEVEAWRMSNPENQKKFSRIERIWEESGRIHGLTNEDVDREWQFFLQNVQKKIGEGSRKGTANQYPLFWKIAAAIAVFAVAIYSLIYFQNSSGTYTADQNIQEVVLEDGTIVTLNKSASLTVASGFGVQDRKVHLKGEAFFDVKGEPHKPFIEKTIK